MRTGDTQATPTANPLVVVTVNGDTHTSEGGGGNDRLVSVYTDEQAWGGQYIVVLDNADEALNAKAYTGEQLDLTWGFVGGSGSMLHRLWVHNQTYTSKEGKLVLSLLCVDAWGLLSYCIANFTNSVWNQWWQADGAKLIASVTYPSGEPITAADAMYDSLLENYGKTVFDIVSTLITSQLVIDTEIAEGETDGIIDVIHPPMSVGDISSGVRQGMEMTKCFLGLRRARLNGDPDVLGTFRVLNPAVHDTVYAFSTANTHFINIQDDAFVAPNNITVWAYNAAGNDWISGYAQDDDAYAQFDVPRHIMLSSLDTDIRSDTDTLDAVALGYLSKIQASAASGEIEAPMHCSLELFDKVSVTDPRYDTPKVSTGYVMRMIRQYDRGVYRIKIQLGGQTSGYTPPGGNGATGLAEGLPTPIERNIPLIPWSTILPRAIQGYWHDIVFTAVDQTHIAWTSTNGIKFYDSTSLTVTADANSEIPGAGIYYIYFDSRDEAPITLNYTTDFAALLTEENAEYLGVLCVVKSGSAPGILPTILPSYGKEPFITTDLLQMAGFKEWTDGVDTYKAILGTDISAGHITLSALQTAGTPSVFRQDAIPTSLAAGDIWFDTNDDNKLYRAGCAGADEIKAGEWELSSDSRIEDALQAASDAQDTADGKIVTFIQAGIPTATDVGDLWVDSDDNNKLYRAASVGANEIKAGEWVLVRDSGISDALADAATAIADAATAQGTANSKVTTFLQTGIPTAVSAGDLWVDTDDHYRMYRAAAAGANEIKAGEWVETLMVGNWYEKTGVTLDATYGISIYGGQGILGLRTFATKTAYDSYIAAADPDSITGVQCYVGTDGKIYAGGGIVYLDSTGLTFKNSLSACRFLDGSNNCDGLLGYGSTYSQMVLVAYNGNSLDLAACDGAEGDAATSWLSLLGSSAQMITNCHIYNNSDSALDIGGKNYGGTIFQWRAIYVNKISREQNADLEVELSKSYDRKLIVDGGYTSFGVVPGSSAYGYVGLSGQYWYRMYADAYYGKSTSITSF